MKLRKGDNVVMLSGKDRGKQGKIIMLSPDANKVVLEGLNMIKRHTKSRQQGKAGQIVSKERAVSIASVAMVCKNCGKVTRVGYRVDGKSKIRICKKCQTEV